MLGKRKARHVNLGDGFPGSAKSRKRSIKAFLLDCRFVNGAGNAGFDVLPNILSKV